MYSDVCCGHDSNFVFTYLLSICGSLCCVGCIVFQAEDGIRDLVRSRGLGDVYKRQDLDRSSGFQPHFGLDRHLAAVPHGRLRQQPNVFALSLIHI